MAVRKVAGLETEYGFLVRGTGGRPSEAEVKDSAGDLIAAVRDSVGGFTGPNEYAAPHCWLPNGGLVSLDTGSHPEYATPETADPFELARQHAHGDQLFADAVDFLNEDAFDLTSHVFKGNVDANNATFGTHESYLVAADLLPTDAARLIGSHLATRTVFTGVGGIEPLAGADGADPVPVRRRRFTRSPRARFIRQLTADQSQYYRPLVDARNEPHADDLRFRRLHLICGEANRCGVATVLKVGTTAIFLAMLEDGVPLADLELRNPLDALWRTARRPDLRRPFLRTRAGEALSPLDHQDALMERAATYVAQRGDEIFSDPETAQAVVDLWRTTLQDLRVDPHATIGKLDWTTKETILARKVHQVRHEAGQETTGWSGAAWDDPRVAQLDLRYGELGATTMFERIRPLVDTNDTAIGVSIDQAAILAPPGDSRAALRGHLVSRRQAIIGDLDWSGLSIRLPGSSAAVAVRTDDPAAFDAAALADVAVLELTDNELVANLTAADLRGHRDYRHETLGAPRAQALLEIADHATPADAAFIADAAAHGLRNTIEQLIRNGRRETLAEITDLFLQAAHRVPQPAQHEKEFAGMLRDMRTYAINPRHDATEHIAITAAVELAEWAVSEGQERHASPQSDGPGRER